MNQRVRWIQGSVNSKVDSSANPNRTEPLPNPSPSPSTPWSLDTWIYRLLNPSTFRSVDPWIHRADLFSVLWIYRSLDPSNLGSIDPWIHGISDLSSWSHLADTEVNKHKSFRAGFLVSAIELCKQYNREQSSSVNALRKTHCPLAGSALNACTHDLGTSHFRYL